LLHIITKMNRHHPTHNVVLYHKSNDPSRITLPHIKLWVQTSDLKTLCHLTPERLSFVSTCATCCIFKEGKCYDTKSSKILHNIVVAKLDGRVVSFDARKQTHKGASHYVSFFFSNLLHTTQPVLFCSKLCSLKLFVKYAALSTGCPRKNMPEFGRVFLMLKYTDITQNTYTQSWTFTEIMAR
jgi:hypothetical protein